MPWYTLRSLTALCVAALVLLVAACEPKSPEEQIAEARMHYTVELLGWTPQDLEPEPVDAMGEDEGASEAGMTAEASSMAAEASAMAAEADEASAGEGEEDMEEETGPRSVNVLFDILVRFDGAGASLPGITAEVVHTDPLDEEKKIYLQWIDTAGMVDGETRQVDFVLEDVEMEEGDAFAVGLTAGIPAELDAYREFSQPTP